MTFSSQIFALIILAFFSSLDNTIRIWVKITSVDSKYSTIKLLLKVDPLLNSKLFYQILDS